MNSIFIISADNEAEFRAIDDLISRSVTAGSAENYGARRVSAENMLNTAEVSEWRSAYDFSRTALVTLSLFFAEALNLLPLLVVGTTERCAARLCGAFERSIGQKTIQNAVSTVPGSNESQEIVFKHFIRMRRPGERDNCNFRGMDALGNSVLKYSGIYLLNFAVDVRLNSVMVFMLCTV